MGGGPLAALGRSALVTSWIEQLIEQMGYLGIAFLMFLENVFPPIPSEVIMPLSGYTASRGELSFWGVVLAGTLGTFAGALLWYYVGRFIDEDRLRRFTGKHGRWLTMSKRDLDRVDKWFEKSGTWAILIGRVVPTIRTLISVPAGIFCMPLAKFVPFTLAGTFAWNLFLAWLGQRLGQNYETVETYLGPVSMAIVAAIVLYYIYRVITFDADAGQDRRQKS